MRTSLAMIGYVISLCAPMACRADGTPAPTVTLQGTYSASAAGPGGTWDAIVVPETGHLHGVMSYDDGSIVALEGTVAGGTVTIEFLAPGAVPGTLTGQVSGTTVSGTYAVGGAQGTWAGQADASLPTN